MAYDVGVLEEPSFTSEAAIRELGASDLDQVAGGGGCLLIVAVIAVAVAVTVAYQEGRENGYEDTRCR